ncbi:MULTISPECIES: response regulator transcription factor EsaR [unclassified Paraburkholderia]|uniref:response regulator transcription factor EsaR n=1 Tax=unclassified Paraburkholderia TaxID=2615204 RepID=UPI00197F0919|nr:MULTISPECIES: response regulator transcription factor EsaR [unclassified Paraburkholderia]MBN3854352.1 response regulator [Paraburkholderia sp. Ac-20340]
MATILVVDDEMGIRELLSEILSDEGHVVELAEDAQQAREFRQRQVPDLVLLDIWMPDTDGVTLLKEWAAQGQLSMPVIMMSGHATIDTAVEATKIGALNFLEKPIALQKLLKAVEQGLARGTAAAAPAAGAPGAKPVAGGPAVVASAAALPVLGVEGSPGVSAAQTASISFDIPLRDARDAFERAYFEYHLARENGSMTRVAEKTGLERTHLYRKLKQLGVDLGKSKGE